MPPPNEYLLSTWNKYASQSPELQKKWGTVLPVDEQGNTNLTALNDLLGTLRAWPTTATTTAAPTAVEDRYGRPEDMTWKQTHLTGVADTGAAAVAPEEVDWGERFGDFGAGLLQLGMGIPYETPIGKYLPGYEVVESRQREAREKIDPEATGFSKFLAKAGAGLSPILGGFEAWVDTVKPVPALVNAMWEPGVRRRIGENMDEGFGLFESAQAAYEQASEAGEIPGWQQLTTEILTDPIELIPGVGVYGAATRAGTRLGVKGAARAAGKELAEKASVDLGEEVAKKSGKYVDDDVLAGRQFPQGEEAARTAIDVDDIDVRWALWNTVDRGKFIEKVIPGLDEGHSLQMQMQAHPLDDLIRQGDERLLSGAERQVAEVVTGQERIISPFQAPTLPRELRGAKPRYNFGQDSYTPIFESDIDRALFIVAKRTPSRRDDDYIRWLQDIFPGQVDPSTLRQAGLQVREHIKRTVRGQETGEIDIPMSVFAKNIIDDMRPAIEKPIEIGAKKTDRPVITPIRFASSLSGGGTVESALTGTVSVHADELSEFAIKVYNDAHGTNYTARDIADNASLKALVESNAKHYHASPVCKNFTNIKQEVIQNKDFWDANDLVIARSVARNIREVKPLSVSLENVPGYQDTFLFKMISKELDDAGYNWDVQIVNAADYGAAQNRSRMIVRAVLDGDLPPLPQKTAPTDWYATLEDLISAELRIQDREKPLLEVFKGKGGGPNDEIARINRYIKMGKLTPDSPIITMGSSASKGVPAAANAGGPAPTLLATRKAVPRIILPGTKGLEDATTIRVTPEMMRRLMGLPDTYKIPGLDLDTIVIKEFQDAKEILGNGVHGKVTENFIQPLVDKPDWRVPTPEQLAKRERLAAAARAPIERVSAQKSIRAHIDSIFHYKHQGINLPIDPKMRASTLKYAKAQQAKNIEEAAIKIFGKSTPSTRKQINDYINYYDDAAKEYSTSVQSLLNKIPGQGTDEAGALSNWYFIPDPNDPSKMIVRVNRPLNPGKQGYMGVKKESKLSEFISRKATGSVAAEIESGASPWVKAMKPNFAQLHLYDELREGTRQLTPDIVDKYKLPKESYIQNAVERLFGTLRVGADYHKQVIDQGSRDLELLGYGTRRLGSGVDQPLLPTIKHIGTVEEPGMVRYLYRALHGDEKAFQALTPEYRQQFYNLKSFTNWEEELRLLNNQISEGQFMDIEDYFHRGWKAQEGLHEKAKFALDQKIKLAGQESFQMGRVKLTFEDLEKLGFEPMYWNPYEQAMYSARMGARQRLEIELVNMMANKEFGMMRIVNTDEAFAEALDEGWKSLDNLQIYKPFRQQFDSLMTDVNPEVAGKVSANQYYMMPKEVATKLENLFGGPRATAMTKERILKMFDWKIHYKADDLIFLPKQLKLVGSFFQQADMAQRTAFGGSGAFLHHVLLGLKTTATPGETAKGIKETIGAFAHLGRMPQGFISMARANFSPGYRKALAKKLQSNEPIWPNHPDPEMRKFTWRMYRESGGNILDETIFNKEASIETFRSLADEGKLAGWGKAPFRILKQIEQAMRRGLFDGVYPAAIMHDVQHNMIPILRLAHPELSVQQLASLVAKESNKAWSTIPIEQSVIQGGLREWTKRLLFSVNEQETFTRMFTGMLHGDNKAYWATRWAGGFMFIAGVANLIHYTHTGEWLPTRRYIPMTGPDSHDAPWRIGYNSAFLSPDLGVPTEGGEAAMLDLVMQADFIGRLFDFSSGIPLMDFIGSRQSVPMRTAFNQVKGEDYFGRPIDRAGFGQRLTQMAYDTLAPIGSGQLAIAAVQKKFEDRELSGPLVKEGVTVRDVMPSVEERLGMGGIAVQALGLNLRAKSNRELQDVATTNTFKEGKHTAYPGAVHTRWKELEDSPEKKRLVYEDSKNADIFAEMSRRRELGLSVGTASKFAERSFDLGEASNDKLEKQATAVSKFARAFWNPESEIWDPREFKNALKGINRDYRAARAQIDKTHGRDPEIEAMLKDIRETPRSKSELSWALNRYKEIRENSRDKLGDIDYDKFEREWQQEIATWEEGAELLAIRVESYLNNSNNHPVVQTYYDALNAIEESGYWSTDFPNTMAALIRSYPDLNPPQVWEEYQKASSKKRTAMRNEPRYKKMLKYLLDTQETHRTNIRLKNPNVDALIVTWMGSQPENMANIPLWTRLYSSTKYRRQAKVK